MFASTRKKIFHLRKANTNQLKCGSIKCSSFQQMNFKGKRIFTESWEEAFRGSFVSDVVSNWFLVTNLFDFKVHEANAELPQWKLVENEWIFNELNASRVEYSRKFAIGEVKSSTQIELKRNFHEIFSLRECFVQKYKKKIVELRH